MVDIKVGMYVRTKYGIAKILSMNYTDDIVEDFLVVDKELEVGLISGCDWSLCDKKDVTKASHNIIDLIEKGDLYIIEFYSPRYKKRVKRLFEVEYKEDCDVSFQNAHCNMNIFGGAWSEEDKKLKPSIKSVVTREQFESMKYEV